MQWCDRGLVARVRLAMLRGDMGTIRYEPGGAVDSQGWPGGTRGPPVQQCWRHALLTVHWPVGSSQFAELVGLVL
jgi:hypothetical protein